jgi:hypothetical protein
VHTTDCPWISVHMDTTEMRKSQRQSASGFEADMR